MLTILQMWGDSSVWFLTCISPIISDAEHHMLVDHLYVFFGQKFRSSAHLKKILYYFLAALGLGFCVRAFSGWGWGGAAPLRCGAQASHCCGCFCCRAWTLGTGPSVFVAHGLSCSTACEIFLDQGLNACPPHWQADSQPLNHQGGPLCPFLNWGVCCHCWTPLCALCLVRLDKPKSQSSKQRKVYWRVKQGAWEAFAQNTQLPDGFLQRVFLFGLVWVWFWGFFGRTVWPVGILLP